MKDKTKIIFHIPHASLKVPKIFYKGLLVSKKEFRKYILTMSDLGVDYLFKDYKGLKIKTKYSRLYCDVERFIDDDKEIMYKYGQGVIYTNFYDGTLFHKHDEKYKKIALKYYKDHHKKLDKIITKSLKRNEQVLLIDLHSFSDKMASFINQKPFPDICIGIDKNYYNEDIINNIILEITKRKLTYQINYPYSGCIIPNCLNNNHKNNITIIMLEINKRIYL